MVVATKAAPSPGFLTALPSPCGTFFPGCPVADLTHSSRSLCKCSQRNVALIIPGKAGPTHPIPADCFIRYQLPPLQSKSMKTGMVSSFCSRVIFLASRAAPGTYRSILNEWGNEGTGKQRSTWPCLRCILEDVQNLLWPHVCDGLTCDALATWRALSFDKYVLDSCGHWTGCAVPLAPFTLFITIND